MKAASKIAKKTSAAKKASASKKIASKPKATQKAARPTEKAVKPSIRQVPPPTASVKPEGKGALIMRLIARDQGATLPEIMSATNGCRTQSAGSSPPPARSG